jgi:hypoxanthine phosphoribosyltransferase
MLLNKKNNMLTIISVIFFIFLYHYFIQNGLEKIFNETYFNYELIKRPLEKCSKYLNGQNLFCVGMPSGHAESVTIVSSLLYFYKFIPLWLCLLLIFIFSIQRIISNMHTLIQVITGISIGFIYFNIYKFFNLSIYSLLIVFSIGFILSLLVVYKLNKEVYKSIPDWVSPEMIPSIQKKQNSLFYMKILTIYANALMQNRTFISWQQLENYLDIIVENIKRSGKHYDAVVGIKTGGAIISDYISQKLNLPNYKVKLSRKEYNCNKQSYNTFNDLINKNIFSNLGEYTVCEPIEVNLNGKNVILVDEMVSSGKTMVEAVEYLKNEKGVNIIYPTTISLNKKLFKQNLKIEYIINDTILIWPWGYDN